MTRPLVAAALPAVPHCAASLAALVLLSAPPLHATPPRRPAERKLATAYHLGAVRLGAPLFTPPMREAEVVGAQTLPVEDSGPLLAAACRIGADQIPARKGTSLVAFGPADNRKNPFLPISAVAWLGGTLYDAGNSDFPVRVGESMARVNAVLGAPLRRFQVAMPMMRHFEGNDVRTYDAGGYTDRLEGWDALTVSEHPGEVWSLDECGRAAGFALGPMPREGTATAWQIVLAEYTLHTVKRRFPVNANALWPYLPRAASGTSSATTEHRGSPGAAGDSDPADLDARMPNELPASARGLELVRRVCDELLTSEKRRPEEMAVALGARTGRLGTTLTFGEGVHFDVRDPVFEGVFLGRVPGYEGPGGEPRPLNYWTALLYARSGTAPDVLEPAMLSRYFGRPFRAPHVAHDERIGELFIANRDPRASCRVTLERPRHEDGTRAKRLHMTLWYREADDAEHATQPAAPHAR